MEMSLRIWGENNSMSFRPQKNYTIEELLNTKFPRLTSLDIYMDPCKAGKEKTDRLL